jgi:hypothetical protein
MSWFSLSNLAFELGPVRPGGMFWDDLLALCAFPLHRTFQLCDLCPLGRSPGIPGYQGRDQAKQAVEAE